MNPGKANEYIRTQGLKGFRKSEVEVIVRSPEGKERQLLLGELAHVKRDHRRSKRRDYVNLFSLSQTPRSDLTYNLATGLFSVTFHSGYHHGYIAFREEREAALIALLYLLLHRSKRLFLQKIGASYSELPLLSKYYVQQFRKKIKAARRSWFMAAKRRRGRR